ncbi:MAG: CoA-binding protein [Bacteroidales bacterium]|nr:CoA-binding protein [Bacteroidales bacterium]
MADINSIKVFFQQKHIAVAGVSRKNGKFGNSIFTELKKKGYTVYPVNPNMDEFDGGQCYQDVASLPPEVTAMVVSTRPGVTVDLVQQALNKGISHIWLQQGSATKEFAASLKEKKNIISGQCIFMFAEPVQGPHKFHRFINKLFGMYPKES